MRIFRSIALIACVAISLHTAAQAQTASYNGVCDASAAAPLDANYFVMADDEVDILRIYRRGSADAVASVDLTRYLSPPRANRKAPRKLREADLEGAARIGNRIYWIGSHGRNAAGKVEPTRQVLFATDIVPQGDMPAVKTLPSQPYRGLLAAMIASPALVDYNLAGASRKPPEAPGALNIEGLASDAQGRLLIGFRNPVPRGKALIVVLTNPAAVVEQGAAPVFDGGRLLELGNRGIRSIDWVEDRFYIVAGAPDDTGDFALYTWSGRDGDAATRALSVDFGTLHPEALFAVPGARQVQVLSDDGGVQVGSHSCKSKATPAASKSFRSVTLRMQ